MITIIVFLLLMHSLLTNILQLCSCKNLLFSDNKLICSFVCFFVQFSASVELDTQKGYLISSTLSNSGLQKKIIAEYPCMVSRILD